VNELVKAHAVRVKNGDRAGADALRNEIEALAPGTMAEDTPPSAPTPSSYTTAPVADEDKDEGFAIDLPDLPAEPEETSLAGFESTAFDAPSADDTDGFQLQGFETTHAEPEVEDEDTFQLADFETTAHEGAVVASDDLGLEPTAFEAPAEVEADALPDLQFDESSVGASAEDDASHDDDASFDLPLLGEEDDAATVSLDGEAADGEFALPDFQIDSPADDDGDDHHDGGFELPMLGEDAADAYVDDNATAGMDDGLSDLTFGTSEIADAVSSEEEEEDPSHAGSFDLGGLSVPTLAEDGVVGDEDVPMLETQTADEENLDDSEYEDFGEYRARPAGAAKESQPAEEPEDEDQAFISDLMASATPAEAEGAAGAEYDDTRTADAAADTTALDAAATDAGALDAAAWDAPADGAGTQDVAAVDGTQGGWDPSALGFDAPATPEASPPAKPKGKGKAKDGSDYIDLGSFLTDDDEDEDNTRFRVQEVAPTGDEDRDFAELLSQFKQKVSENVSAEDSAAHYDLGLAFKEMGLVDEAIGEFQIAMRAGDMRLRVYEELGQCFLLKEQFNIAEKVLTRALTMQQGNDLEMIGVYYHLGRAYEGLGNRDAARDAYERVLGLDINFQDVAARLKRL
jgi:tetratricopeptide (TPR) repeat protein